MATFYKFYSPCNLESDGYDTDVEFDEEEHCFNMKHNDAAIEKSFRRQIKPNLRRKDGHYQMETRVKRVHDEQQDDPRFYSGHHWEVDGRYHSESEPEDTYGDEFNNRPLQLERTTCKLTIIAVQDAMNAEQRRRVRRQKQTSQKALKIFKPLNRELEQVITRNEERLKKEKKSFVRDMGDAKDEFMIELTRRYQDGVIEKEFEVEKDRRLHLYDEMTDSDQTDPQFLLRVTSLAKNSKYWRDIQFELSGAFNDLDEVHKEENHAVDDLFLELKDEFIQSFKSATNLMKLHMTEERERRRRLWEVRSLASGQREIDGKRKLMMESKTNVDEELRRMNAGVTKADCFDQGVGLGFSTKVMDHSLEVMVRRVNAILVDRACAEERAIRLGDIAVEIQHGGLDSLTEALKDAMLSIQEQMLLSIFHGHKVSSPMKMESNLDGETEQDKKLRTARLKSRRQSCVVT
ncbi:hypothetical protein BSL78_10248 [Apostichopus japonicus]|uniref:Uncharacterized protein n=1 Tax=Stichopus japonicus TaxID=307972 RepID=A0A2G8KXX7_STIJA|nr:hypothetical protein BSL78_10248 [Apostichopus japonicus]